MSTEFRKQFEEWAEESFGGDAKRFFVRCDPPHEDEYQHADVQMAWMAAQYFCARGPAGAATRVALKERLVEGTAADDVCPHGEQFYNCDICENAALPSPPEEAKK